ncbi:phosphatase PAP2 family protein [Mesorhizobium sp. C416B]|uniref:phosphatase PAP2 family protein n=1 Tax=unclassified Mesorhizobium TaxID=325217 RepID=UPI0018DB9036|nr:MULTISPECIES: phosphatase PAP2 family protein [unclassified Mesorhizobium]WJI61906.1 phosphatase PAP2 family protein [Mesorhizobium sp. C416B]
MQTVGHHRATFASSRISNAGFLAVVAICAVSLLTFGFLVAEMRLDQIAEVDKRLLLSLRNPSDLSNPLGPVWFGEMVRDFTALGSTGVLVFVTAAGIGYMYAQGMVKEGVYLLLVVASGRVTDILLKYFVARPRPAIVPHIVTETTTSFPSSHAMMSAVVYLSIAVIVISDTNARKFAKVYFLSVAILLTSVIGASRVYLGVHWPSDVLAGWSVGVFWVTACWILKLLVPRSMQRQKERS